MAFWGACGAALPESLVAAADIPDRLCKVVRARIVRAKQQKNVKYRELMVRSAVVKGMTNIQMLRHIKDLGQRPHALKLLQVHTESGPAAEDVEKRIRAHIEARVDA